MVDFGPAVVLGLCFGFMFGIECSLAVMYSIYLGDYHKAIEVSLLPVQPKRFTEALRKVQAKRAGADSATSVR